MTSTLFAIDGKIKVFIKSNDAIYTSQKVTVSVELLSDAFSITDAKITFSPSKEYIVQSPKSATYLGQTEVNGSNWQMVHYDYEVYALKAGKIEIPSVSVNFTASMGYGQPKKEFALSSDSLVVDVKTPEGVNTNQFVLVTDKFVLESNMNPEKKQLIVGDAVVLTLTQKAKGVPDILLSPIIYKSNAFLRVYVKEPLLKSGLDGSYDISRTDSFTFVASSEGNVTIPVKEVLWWDSKTKKMHTEKTPAYTFEIIPDPQLAINAKKAQQKQRLLYVLLVVLVLVGLYLFFASKIREYLKERKCLYAQSEVGKFALLLACIEKNDVHCMYAQMYEWLLSIALELTRGGFSTIIEIQPSFKTSLDALEENLLTPNQRFDTILFSEELNRLRATLLKKEQTASEGLPQTINPN
jgi:hypothetical protein